MYKATLTKFVIVSLSLLSICLMFRQSVQQYQIDKLRQQVDTYEERQLSLISRDKALQRELADLKKYISTGISAGG